MRRHPSLQALSDDHHRALVLARRLRRTSPGSDATALAALSREVRSEFATDLEPHFRVEETWLLPALEGRGAADFAQRIREEHARLRELVRGAWAGDTPEQLGTLLERHVRFEERMLFPKAEQILSEDELASVRDASDARRGA